MMVLDGYVLLQELSIGDTTARTIRSSLKTQTANVTLVLSPRASQAYRAPSTRPTTTGEMLTFTSSEVPR